MHLPIELLNLEPLNAPIASDDLNVLNFLNGLNSRAIRFGERLQVPLNRRKEFGGDRKSSREELRADLTLFFSGFERVCQRLLRESGFENVTVTGKSQDGGIDGIGVL
jgi:Restriction endonuclease